MTKTGPTVESRTELVAATGLVKQMERWRRRRNRGCARGSEEEEDEEEEKKTDLSD